MTIHSVTLVLFKIEVLIQTLLGTRPLIHTLQWTHSRTHMSVWYYTLLFHICVAQYQGHREFPFGNLTASNPGRELPGISWKFDYIQFLPMFFSSSCIFYFRQPILSNKIAVPQSRFQIQISFSEFIFRSFRFSSDTTPPEVQNKKVVTILWTTLRHCVCFLII